MIMYTPSKEQNVVWTCMYVSTYVTSSWSHQNC